MDNKQAWQSRLPENISTVWPEEAAAVAQSQSLTAALRRLGGTFSVRLLHLGACGFDALFSDGLNGADEQAWFARDVLLCMDGIPVVWARSLCAASAKDWKKLLDCGARPLGERLFDGSLPLARSPFEYAEPKGYLPPEPYGKAVLVRRSFFDWHGKRLGLAECFFPDLQNFV